MRENKENALSRVLSEIMYRNAMMDILYKSKSDNFLNDNGVFALSTISSIFSFLSIEFNPENALKRLVIAMPMLDI